MDTISELYLPYLATVRQLLNESKNQNSPQDQKNNQQDQQQSWEEQKTQQEQQQSQWWVWKQEQWTEESSPPISDSIKQQLEQYQAQLLREQTQNQQFFDKSMSQTDQNDPFGAREQLFGWTPQFDSLQNSWTKDW